MYLRNEKILICSLWLQIGNNTTDTLFDLWNDVICDLIRFKARVTLYIAITDHGENHMDNHIQYKSKDNPGSYVCVLCQF